MLNRIRLLLAGSGSGESSPEPVHVGCPSSTSPGSLPISRTWEKWRTSPVMRPQPVAAGRSAAWMPLAAVLLACLYLPSLNTPFDFIDDGNLVYPSAPMPLGVRLGLVWRKIAANYQHLGPFRPVLWVHWEVQAELFRANPVAWRASRLVWAALAATVLLWLMRELGIRPGAAILAATLAMWNPYRNEIWTSLTLSEGVAMPYALLVLVCAVRATRSQRPWRWDLAGSVCLLAALGCKNTFAALVPAQLLLRILASGLPLREAWRSHARRATFLTLPLLMPVVHFIVFKLGWHAGQYRLGLSWLQLSGMLRTLGGAISLSFVGPGLIVAAFVVALHHKSSTDREPWAWLGMVCQRHRVTCMAGLALLVCGTAPYLLASGVAGRYAIPAVWGADLAISILLTELAAVRAIAWRRMAYGFLGCGLVAVAVANVGRQDRFAARAALLWQVLEHVAAAAPPETCMAWMEGQALNVEEGIHFAWHLQARGRADIVLGLLDEERRPLSRLELAGSDRQPSLLVSGTPIQPDRTWRRVRDFSAFYWAGQRRYDCYLWQAAKPDRPAAP
jgi:hypothetical protein